MITRNRESQNNIIISNTDQFYKFFPTGIAIMRPGKYNIRSYNGPFLEGVRNEGICLETMPLLLW